MTSRHEAGTIGGATRPTLDACLRPEPPPARPSFDVLKSDVPERRRAVVERVIEVAFPRVVEHLALPPETWEAEGRRGVWLWGVLEISAAADGTDLRLDYITDDPDADGCAATANLSQPINRFGFPAAMSPILVAAARECGLHPKTLSGPTGMYIRRVFARTFHRCVDWNRLRRGVLRQLRLDPLVVSLTHRTFHGGPERLETFNWVARHVRELALVAAEHPRLLPFLQLVSSVEGSPVEAFERAVREAGITPSARRKLERWGFEPFSQATGFCMMENCIETVARLANLLDRLEIHEPLHPMFGVLALRAGIDSTPDWFLRTLHKELVARDAETFVAPGVAAATMARGQIHEEDFDLVAIWLNTKQPLPDPQQQHSWPWIVEQAWRHRALTDAAARAPWPVPSETLAIAGFQVVPLRCALDLRMEGEVMRNCLATYENECRAGRIAVYSIRKGERRFADIAVARVKGGGGFWQVMQVAGKRNREVPEMAGVAMGVVRRLGTPGNAKVSG
ncbi:MAG TPA: PcfJ domain-containing protein [Usitatibacter sp.]|nr:PcfJ domain-containing protein [Usitatibacter sp.]